MSRQARSKTVRSAEPPAQDGGDWAADAAGRIEDVVSAIKAKTVDRLVRVARLVVYGLVAAAMGIAAAVLATVGSIRLLDVWVPRGVWLPDLIVGTIFSLTGLFLWSRRTAKPSGR